MGGKGASDAKKRCITSSIYPEVVEISCIKYIIPLCIYFTRTKIPSKMEVRGAALMWAQNLGSASRCSTCHHGDFLPV